jgi:hypothetical protein
MKTLTFNKSPNLILVVFAQIELLYNCPVLIRKLSVLAARRRSVVDPFITVVHLASNRTTAATYALRQIY